MEGVCHPVDLLQPLDLARRRHAVDYRLQLPRLVLCFLVRYLKLVVGPLKVALLLPHRL